MMKARQTQYQFQESVEEIGGHLNQRTLKP